MAGKGQSLMRCIIRTGTRFVERSGNIWKKNCGDPLNDLVENVTKDLLPSRINFLEKMIKTLLQTREKILMDMETLEELQKKVDAMNISASKIQAALNEFQM